MTVAEFVNEFERLAGRDLDPTPILEAARPVIIKAIQANFDAASSPGGNSWPPRKDPASGDHPLLNKTGALMNAATGGDVNEISDGLLEIGVDARTSSIGSIRGAAAHNYGYAPNHLPQREYMGLSDETLDELAQQAADRGLQVMLGDN